MKINRKTFKSLEEFSRMGRGCATLHPNHYQITSNDERLAASRFDTRTIETIEVDVQFIHITDGHKTGVITEKQRKDQIAVLNKAYRGASITFSYDPSQVKTVDNKRWFGMGHGTAEEREAKSALHGSPERHLNFYTGGLRPGLLGWATFPWQLEGDRDLDGVAILHSSLPGGSSVPFNLGMTAVHEVGHWLGLYHTFQGGCDAVGDHVNDTVAHAGPNTGKPTDGQAHNACDAQQQAPVHNYMNYSDDDWMTEFSSGQIERIKKHLAEYRPGFIRP